MWTDKTAAALPLLSHSSCLTFTPSTPTHAFTSHYKLSLKHFLLTEHERTRGMRKLGSHYLVHLSDIFPPCGWRTNWYVHVWMKERETCLFYKTICKEIDLHIWNWQPLCVSFSDLCVCGAEGHCGPTIRHTMRMVQLLTVDKNITVENYILGKTCFVTICKGFTHSSWVT